MPMLRSINSIQNYALLAHDGEIGRIVDLLFHDRFWIVRYLVVDTGHWLPGRKVLLAAHVLGQPDWMHSHLPVNLNREQVKSSPEIDADMPVSHQQQIELQKHYRWQQHWAGGGMWPNPLTPLGPVGDERSLATKEQKHAADQGDPHLRSAREVNGYHIQASDGNIGHVDDFIVEDTVWHIRYLVVNTHNWLPGRKVLVAPQWLVGPINWSESKVAVSATKESIKNSPPYNPDAPVNRDYEARLYDYYGRPGYWGK